MAREAIFIGYRRDDTADVAGRVFDAMAQRFGRQRIFKDVDNIGPGVDFGDYIKSVLPRCRVALVLIGPHWLDSKDESGRRRIDDEHDWVRVEIETALATPELLVVPVLVNGARMPRSEEVSESLRPLLRRNAAIIRRDPDFHDDVERLAAALRSSIRTGILDLSKIGGKSSGAPTPTHASKGSRAPLLIIATLAAAIALVAAGVGVSRWLAPANTEPAQVLAATTQPIAQDSTQAEPEAIPSLSQQPSAAPPMQDAKQRTPTSSQVEERAAAPAPAQPDQATLRSVDSGLRVGGTVWDECRTVRQLVVHNGVESSEDLRFCRNAGGTWQQASGQ